MFYSAKIFKDVRRFDALDDWAHRKVRKNICAKWMVQYNARRSIKQSVQCCSIIL